MIWKRIKVVSVVSGLEMELIAHCNSATISAHQQFEPQRGSITDVTIKAEKTEDIGTSLAVLKADYGDPQGINSASKPHSYLWTKPLIPWPSALQSALGEDRISEMCEQNKLTHEEEVALSSILLVFQLVSPPVPRLIHYVAVQVRNLDSRRQSKLIDLAFKIKETADAALLEQPAGR
jgi:hypothetical protein